MKKLLLVLSLGTALLLSQSAFADHRYSQRGYSNWGYQGGYRHGRQWGAGHAYRNANRHFNAAYGNRHFNRHAPYGYGGSYVSLSYGNRYRGYRGYRRDYDGAEFIGGLVLGSLLSHGVHNARTTERVVYRSQPPVRSREVVTVKRSRTTAPAAGSRRLLRDLDGNCFEITRSSAGEELRLELDPAACSY